MSGALETLVTAKMQTLMPRLVTRREIIKAVPERYVEQYPNADATTVAGRCGDTIDQLRALDLNTASCEDIAKIIGNDSWTKLECSVCEMDRDAVVSVPREYDEPLLICERCAAGVLAIFQKEPAQ